MQCSFFYKERLLSTQQSAISEASTFFSRLPSLMAADKPYPQLQPSLLKGANEINENLNKTINDRGKIHVTPCRVGANFILRFAVCSKFTESEDIQFAYDEISEVANELLSTTV